MTCSWNSWGSWSGTCGRITRQRTSKATQHVVNRPNCNGLQTSCPAPQTEFTFISCEFLFYRSICTVLYKVEILYTCLSVRRFFFSVCRYNVCYFNRSETTFLLKRKSAFNYTLTIYCCTVSVNNSFCRCNSLVLRRLCYLCIYLYASKFQVVKSN